MLGSLFNKVTRLQGLYKHLSLLYELFTRVRFVIIIFLKHLFFLCTLLFIVLSQSCEFFVNFHHLNQNRQKDPPLIPTPPLSFFCWIFQTPNLLKPPSQYWTIPEFGVNQIKQQIINSSSKMLTKNCIVYRQISQFFPTKKHTRFFLNSSMIVDLSIFIQIKPNFAIFRF